MKRTSNNDIYRYIARITLEAASPLSIGSGKRHILTDSPVARDVNGLPYIPGSSITGVLRHLCEDEASFEKNITDPLLQDLKELFGWSDKFQQEGSRINITDAVWINSKGIAVDHLMQASEKDDSYYLSTQGLVTRQHVRINGKGSAVKGAKFDNQAIHAGTRFVFEMEVSANDLRLYETFLFVLQMLKNEGFRIGGKTRSGLGKIRIVKCQTAHLNLTQKEDLDLYLEKSSSLEKECHFLTDFKFPNTIKEKAFTTYRLLLQAEDYYMFGLGTGSNENTDMSPVRESIVEWNGNKASICENCILIPGSSIKGAIAHRVAFHYNRNSGLFAGNENAKEGSENPAVRKLFGYQDEDELFRGNVLISDLLIKLPTNYTTKLFNHVSINDFTSGSRDGALFSDDPDNYSSPFEITISVQSEVLKEQAIEKALEMTFDDLCSGMLPLGGGVNRGLGCFYGNWKKD